MEFIKHAPSADADHTRSPSLLLLWPTVSRASAPPHRHSLNDASSLTEEAGLAAICEGSHGPFDAVAEGDGETHCSKFRSDEIPGRNKFAEPSSEGPCGFTLAGARSPVFSGLGLDGRRRI